MARKAYFDTTVAESRSREQIEHLLQQYGADAIRRTVLPDETVLEFKGPHGSFLIRGRYSLGDAPKEAQRRRQREGWAALQPSADAVAGDGAVKEDTSERTTD